MYYNVYIDEIFIFNLLIDGFLLLMIRRALNCNCGYFSVILVSSLSALVSCLMIIFPACPNYVRGILIYGITGPFMLRIGLRIKRLERLLAGSVFLYIASFFMSGAIQFFVKRISTGNVIICAFFVCILTELILGLYMSQRKQMSFYVDVEMGEHSETVIAINDTGNQLHEPISGQPVSVIDEAVMKRILENNEDIQMRIIPYHTIGVKNGILYGYLIDALHIHTKMGMINVKNTYLAVAPTYVSKKGEYHMILHPKLLEKQEEDT